MFFRDKFATFPLTVLFGLVVSAALVGDAEAATAESADARPPCPQHPTVLAGDVFKTVETPDVSLLTHEGKASILANGGWFIANAGSAERPEYFLFRLTQEGVLSGGRVPSLGALGPTVIQEVPLAEAQAVGKVPEADLSRFYRLEPWPKALGDEYRTGLERRAQFFGERIDLTKEGFTPEALKRLERTVFGEIEYQRQPEGKTVHGEVCEWKAFASVTAQDETIRQRIYPLLGLADSDEIRWVTAHEIGHALDRILDLPSSFSDLPSETRAALLEEMADFHQYLKEHGMPRNGATTPRELIADMLSYTLREPELVRTEAPQVYAFIQKEIAADPVIAKLFVLR